MTNPPKLRSTLSTVKLSELNWPRRVAIRPESQRQPDFDQKFDSDTLFYDIFWRDGELTLIGPPIQLTGWRRRWRAIQILNHIKIPSFFSTRWTWRCRFGSRAFIATHRGAYREHITIGRKKYPVYKATPLTEHRKVFFTKQKNNDLESIRSWILTNTRLHSPDAFLIYDDQSTKYTIAELALALSDMPRPIYLQSFNFPHGAGAWNSSEWDSDFAQYGGLEHARLAWMRRDALMVNTDIDEIIECHDLFEKAENNPVIYFKGRWAYAPAGSNQKLHASHTYGDQVPTCPVKWIANLGKIPRKATLYVHEVQGTQHLLADFFYRHHFGVSNSWKFNREFAPPYNPSIHLYLEQL